MLLFVGLTLSGEVDRPGGMEFTTTMGGANPLSDIYIHKISNVVNKEKKKTTNQKKKKKRNTLTTIILW
jgi:hypothetical protein